MLTTLKLGNFKAFKETQTIPLRPLTLIFGANSSGKSSIIHGLLFAHEAHRSGNLDVQRTELGGDSVDLGGFRQFVYGAFPSRCVEWQVELDVACHPRWRAPLRKVRVCYSVGEIGETERPEHCLFSYTIEADRSTVLRATRQAGGLRVEQLDQTHPVFQEAINFIQQMERASQMRSVRQSKNVDNEMKDLIPQLVLSKKFPPSGLLDESITGTEPGRSRVRHKPGRLTLAARARYVFPRAVDQFLRGVCDVMASELERLSYLGPLRSYPPRHFIFDQYQDPNWFAGGGHAYDIARRDLNVLGQVNKWLGDEEKLSTPYALLPEHLWKGSHLTQVVLPEMLDRAIGEVGKTKRLGGARDAILKAMSERLQAIEASRNRDPLMDPSYLQVLLLVDKRSNTFVSHRDIGVGVSQVLPVLVHAYASKNRIVAIEQPEIHLHPKLQAELADVFIESALGGRRNMFILETHSEHFILRVMRRIRETSEGRLPPGIRPVRPNDVVVLYVEPDGERSVVREMPLNERGELVKAWPGGFFEEGLREVLP